MPETGTQNSSTSIASQLIRELELNGPLPDPRTDTDHQSLVSIYPELGAVSAVDITVPTPEGGVPGRLYRAPGEALGGFVWVHGGASAGAALTAALTGRLRDDAGQMPASLLLAYPLVHAEIPALSEELGKKMDGVPAELAFGPDFIHDINLNFAGSEDSFRDPHAFAGGGDLHGFPPVYIINSEADTLRASGELFAAQLEAAGVPVRMEMEPGSMHGHLDHPHSLPARSSVERMLRWLRSDRCREQGPIVGTVQN